MYKVHKNLVQKFVHFCHTLSVDTPYTMCYNVYIVKKERYISMVDIDKVLEMMDNGASLEEIEEYLISCGC